MRLSNTYNTRMSKYNTMESNKITLCLYDSFGIGQYVNPYVDTMCGQWLAKSNGFLYLRKYFNPKLTWNGGEAGIIRAHLTKRGLEVLAETEESKEYMKDYAKHMQSMFLTTFLAERMFTLCPNCTANPDFALKLLDSLK